MFGGNELNMIEDFALQEAEKILLETGDILYSLRAYYNTLVIGYSLLPLIMLIIFLFWLFNLVSGKKKRGGDYEQEKK
jgi:hypothetical protein